MDLLVLFVQPKPDPVEQSKLFGLISEDFVSLLHSMELKHKDEVFVVRSYYYNSDDFYSS